MSNGAVIDRYIDRYINRYRIGAIDFCTSFLLGCSRPFVLSVTKNNGFQALPF
jgi:hypothetical protein